jgi:hypothetical protein
MFYKKIFVVIFIIFTITIIGGSGCKTNEKIENKINVVASQQQTTPPTAETVSIQTETPKIESTVTPKPKSLPMQITSPSFSNNGNIPSEFTCSGSDLNPQLNFANIPENTKSLALIMDDPDAPNSTWIHWVIFNISPKTTVINKNSAPSGAIQGINSWGTSNYGGPCPPSGTHRYFFKLYALDNTLSLSSSASKANVESAMQGHILSQATLIGKYAK